MIRLENVTKKFGEKLAIKGVNLEVGRGEVVGFLGPNGAGKTTTLRLIVGFLSPTAGQILVDGHDPIREGLQVRSKIGYLAENNPLYVDLPTIEYLNFIAQIKDHHSPVRHQSLAQTVEICGLTEVKKQLIGELSRGFRQRVGLAAALLGDPKILIMDEPTAGLDPNQIIEIRHLIKDLGRERTVILSTHIIPEVSQTCSRVVIIKGGEIVADKSVHEFHGEEEFQRLTREEQI